MLQSCRVMDNKVQIEQDKLITAAEISDYQVWANDTGNTMWTSFKRDHSSFHSVFIRCFFSSISVPDCTSQSPIQEVVDTIRQCSGT
jgi:hypothetical protein